MIPPKPFKYVCPKCGYERVVKIESDIGKRLFNDEFNLPEMSN
jgi:hypothetical protein